MALQNAYPRPELYGIKDESARALQAEPLSLPTHLPLFWLFTERGRSKPQLVSGDRVTRLFGQKSFDLTSIYATHATLFANTAIGNGNAVMLQRVKPADAAPPASVVLWLDILDEDVPLYERNIDGSIARDTDGTPLPVLSGGNPVLVPGKTAKWVKSELPKVNAAGDVITQSMITAHATDPLIDITPVANVLGSLSPVVGDRTNGSETSMRYPIFEFEVDSFGSYGNNLALRLSAVTEKSSVPVNETTVIDNNSFLYRLQMIERDTATNTSRIVETISGEQFLDLMFKPRAYNRTTKQDLEFDRIYPKAWTDESNNIDPTYGPFGRFHVYNDLLLALSGDVATLEADEDLTVSAADADRYMINLLTGVNVQGNPYATYQVLGTAQGGLLLNEFSNIYAAGGNDGTMSFQTFDDLVAYEAGNFGDTGYALRDSALYPISSIWDSGFSLETKYKLLVPMARRKDVVTHLCTQDLSQPKNSTSADSSIAVSLYNMARIYSESAIFGTPACRATVMKQSGKLITSTWTGLAPLNLELLNKVSKYMGSGDGIWKNAFRFDTSPLNRITMFNVDSIGDLSLGADSRARDWANGCIWAQAYDMQDAFIPGFQTVYDDDTSVLNSIITVYGCVELEKVAERTWRDLTGDTSLTDEQFLERSDDLINERVRGRFDNRFTIQPRTFLTAIDANNGFSWSCEIKIYANNMRTVGKFTIISRRSSDLTATA
jgi:hypothetical protein